MNSSHNQDTTATRGGASSVATPANTVSGIFSGPEKNRRKSSQSGDGSMFSGLRDVKRDPGNEAQAARRQSLSDQAPKPGVLGQVWQNITKG